MAKTDIDTLKLRLVQACRLLAQEGQGDYIWGHVTLRLPDRPDHLLMKPARIRLEEIGPDDVITVNLSGDKVDGAALRHSQGFILTEVVRQPPAVTVCVQT